MVSVRSILIERSAHGFDLGGDSADVGGLHAGLDLLLVVDCVNDLIPTGLFRLLFDAFSDRDPHLEPGDDQSVAGFCNQRMRFVSHAVNVSRCGCPDFWCGFLGFSPRDFPRARG